MKKVCKKKRFHWFRTFIAVIVIIFFVFCSVIYFYPVKHLDIINKYSEKYNLRPEFICAIINTESGFEEREVSPKGAMGLMQVMKTTSDWAANSEGISEYDFDNIFEPELNIHIGCWYVAWLSDKYDNDKTLILSAYNAGSGNVAKWLSDDKYSKDGKTLDVIPFEETSNYVKKVISAEKFYKYILKVFNYLNLK